MRARPYKLFGAHERAVLAELLEQRIRPWARDWFPARPPLRLECFPADLERREWLGFANPAGEWWALAAAEAEIDALAAELCGAPGRAGPSALAAEAARAALHDLAAALAGGSVSPLEQVTPDFAAPGSAAFTARVTLGGAALRLVASPEWTLRALRERLPAPAPAPLAGRRQAIASRPVSLRVVAGWAEVELAELRGLQAGDVITLHARVERPMSLVLEGREAPLCGARVGLKDGRRAAALVSSRGAR
jgi:flagellar motor switch/type III secretory pathway protein FliN